MPWKHCSHGVVVVMVVPEWMEDTKDTRTERKKTKWEKVVYNVIRAEKSTSSPNSSDRIQMKEKSEKRNYWLDELVLFSFLQFFEIQRQRWRRLFLDSHFRKIISQNFLTNCKSIFVFVCDGYGETVHTHTYNSLVRSFFIFPFMCGCQMFEWASWCKQGFTFTICIVHRCR